MKLAKAEVANLEAAIVAASAAKAKHQPDSEMELRGPNVDASRLYLQLHVATLSDGAIPMPPSTEYALIEIGCSDRDTVDNEMKLHPKGFLISFEPLLDKYAVLLARGTPRYHMRAAGTHLDKAVPLSHHHQQGVVLPMAISPRGGPLTFTVSTSAGCSSMMKINRRASWGQNCLGKPMEERQVPSMSLGSAIKLAGNKLVKFIKMDAQGGDLSIVLATPAHLLKAQVQTIQMETRASDCTPLYEGQGGCNDMAAYMLSIGFVNRTACFFGSTKDPRHPGSTANCEQDMIFDNTRFREGRIDSLETQKDAQYVDFSMHG